MSFLKWANVQMGALKLNVLFVFFFNHSMVEMGCDVNEVLLVSVLNLGYDFATGCG